MEVHYLELSCFVWAMRWGHCVPLVHLKLIISLMQKPYTGDSALLSALLVSSQKPVGFDPSQRGVVPCFVVQYKPRVSPDLADQDPFHLSEVFLQAYYLRKMHKHPILHCLTDLSDFHYFLVKESERGNLEIENYFCFKCNFNEAEELLLTLKLLCYIITESCLSQLL